MDIQPAPQLTDVFQDNLKIFARWEYTSASGRTVRFPDRGEMLRNTKVYRSEFSMEEIPPFPSPTVLRIEETETMSAAREMQNRGLNPAVHSFANGYHPCGLYSEGAPHLEEKLCRLSTLSETLNQFEDDTDVYPMNKNHGGIYSRVTVFRDEKDYSLLDIPYEMPVISVAALNLRSNNVHPRIVQNLEYALHGENALTPEGMEIMLNKMRTIFRIAIDNHHDSIVLGAWGCGIYKQRPKQLASMFKSVLDEIEFRRKFREVMFAIDGHKNYVHFVRGIEGNARFRCSDRPAYFCYKAGKDNIWGAEYPGDMTESVAREKLQHAIDFGITHFIDLTEENELPPYCHLLPKDGSAQYLRFPIKDASAPESIESVCQLLDRMRHILSNPTNKIYLHCWGGVGRTGTIVACWIAREYGMTYYKTITNLLSMWKTCLKSANQSIPDHWSQKEFIKNFAEYHTPHVPLPTLFPPSP